MLQIDSKSLKFHAKKVVITSNRHVVTKIIERKAMGLAASQARFLAITARKMNCEFQSMQIAQEKLSTTRDMEKFPKIIKMLWIQQNLFGIRKMTINTNWDMTL